MSEPSSGEYDLKPEEPKPASGASSPETPPSATPTPAAVSAGGGGEVTPGSASAPPPAAPEMPAPPPGFVPPKPVILGPHDEDPDIKDAEEHRVVAILAYLPGFFLLPLLFAGKSKFARYHANQGLLVFVVAAVVFLAMVFFGVVNAVGDNLPVGGQALYWPLVVVKVCGCFLQFGLAVSVMALALVGIINASNGERKPLPVIGKVTLIKYHQ